MILRKLGMALKAQNWSVVTPKPIVVVEMVDPQSDAQECSIDILERIDELLVLLIAHSSGALLQKNDRFGPEANARLDVYSAAVMAHNGRTTSRYGCYA